MENRSALKKRYVDREGRTDLMMPDKGSLRVVDKIPKGRERKSNLARHRIQRDSNAERGLRVFSWNLIKEFGRAESRSSGLVKGKQNPRGGKDCIRGGKSRCGEKKGREFKQ